MIDEIVKSRETEFCVIPEASRIQEVLRFIPFVTIAFRNAKGRHKWL